MSERRRTSFKDILSQSPEAQETQPIEITSAEEINGTIVKSPKKNKSIDPTYTKLTAYIPRTLASAVKMSMALEGSTDQSSYVEQVLVEWFNSRGRGELLKQSGYVGR